MEEKYLNNALRNIDRLRKYFLLSSGTLHPVLVVWLIGGGKLFVTDLGNISRKSLIITRPNTRGPSGDYQGEIEGGRNRFGH